MFSSGQLNSLYFKDNSVEKEFICSTEDSSGMHKCNSLPLFVAQDGQVWIKKKIKLAFSKFYLMVFV